MSALNSGARHGALRAALRRVAIGALVALALVLLTVAPAFAEQAADGTTPSGVAGFGMWDWLGLMLRISAVLGVIWLSVLGIRWYVRRMSGEASGRPARQLQIMETRALGPNRALHLVRLGNRAVLIGATAERINALMEIEDPAELERLFEGDEGGTQRGAASLFASIASMPALAGRARNQLQTRRNTLRELQEASIAEDAAAAEPAPRATGGVRSVLGSIARGMRRITPRQAATAPAPRPMTADDAFTAMRSRAPRVTPKPPQPAAAPSPSLFERTLAQAEAIGAGRPLPAAEPVLSVGLRARSGYEQAMPTDADLSREERINELQRAISSARRSVG